MKKPLFKTFALLTAALVVSLTTQFTMKGVAELADSQPSVEAVETEGAGAEAETMSEAKLRVRRCDFTVVVGERAFYLPEFDATSADGTDITHLVTITDSKQSEIDVSRGTIVLREPGDHVITYSVVDPATNETLTRSFTVTQQREVFNYYNLTGERYEKTSMSEQYCISLNPGQGISRFNMPVSDTYYAEVYFNATEATQFRAGLAHVVRTNFDKGVNSNLWWASMVDVENGMSHSIYKDEDWKLTAIDGTEKETTLAAGEGFKYAVARIGTTMYAFINDVLVEKYVCNELAGIKTAPGIFTAATKEGDFVKGGGVKISEMDYVSGVAALVRISSLTGEKIDTDVKVDIAGGGWGAFDTPYNRD